MADNPTAPPAAGSPAAGAQTTSSPTAASGSSPPAQQQPAGQAFANVDDHLETVVPETHGEHGDDSDSNYYSDSQSDTTSISSSVTDYVYENGRRYHAFQPGKYTMPNDEDEKDRLDLAHHVFLLTTKGALHQAPLPKDPQTILDLGTGTGIWALDMADLYPSARVIGTDLSAIQPRWVAPNLEFFIDDFEVEWTYKKNYFDYIHSRTIAGCVNDWPKLMKQAYDHLKPGGWYEGQEVAIQVWSDDGSLEPDSPYQLFLNTLNSAAESTGRPLNIAANVKQWVEDAGFVNVQEKVFMCPWAPWPKDPYLKEIGKYQYVNVHHSIEAYSLALFTRVLGYSEDRAKIEQALVKDHLKSKKLHAYGKIYFVYGQKPEEPKGSN